ncbi:MAG: (d)CMP kinase [Candidatus Riflebacteria bacterium]|nr:(d)CMP kinase [Candidatus Riflebacteria bacterium]
MHSPRQTGFCEVVAIDGPAGAGKSTVARMAAEKLGYSYLDTGAMYRAVTLKALQENIDFSDAPALRSCADKCGLRFETRKGSSLPLVFLHQKDITNDIRKPEVSRNVSAVAADPGVRESMTALQREIGQHGKWVVDGRDIGSVVFPTARVKIYLTASIEERANRRLHDLHEKGFDADIESLKQEIAKRDEYDSNRECAPLKQADGAVFLDTTAMTIEQVIDRIIIIVTNTRDNKIPTEERMDQVSKTNTQQEPAEGTMEENQMTMEEALNGEFRTISRGAIVTGTVIEKNQTGIYVDLGYKSDGIVPIDEFDGEESKYNVGDEIRVYVKKIDDGHGQLILSYRRAKELGSWDELDEAFSNKTPVEATIKERIKGGYNVSVMGVRAFLPQSQLSHGKNAKESIGKTFPMVVTEFDRRRKNVVVSERAVLDKVRDKRKNEIFDKYKTDDVIKGVVSRIVEYGAFIDLGDGVEGLIHRNDLSWSVISNPREVVQPGEEIEARILKMDTEKGKISLGLKQKKDNPWETVDTRYKVGQKYHGKVKNLMDFGAFVELEEGVEGLVHISDLSWARNIKHPSEVVKSGDELDIVVKEIDKEKKRISLSYKEVLPHPWDQVTSTYKIGDVVTGKVNNMTDFGAFIEIQQGIEGLLHVSDMDWVKKVNHPKEILEKGQEVKVKILNIDSANHRLSLGLKQTTTDPWEAVEYQYRIGEQVTGVVKNLVPYGAFIQLENGIEGLLHVSEFSWQNDAENPANALKVGDQITVMVYEIDKNKQKIGLSLRRLQDDPWKEVERKFNKDSVHQGKVSALLENGVEIEVTEGVIGFVHISQLSPQRVSSPSEVVKQGDTVTYKVLELDRKNRRMKLSIKEANMDSDAKELKKYQAESETGFSDTIGDLLKAQLESFKSKLDQ